MSDTVPESGARADAPVPAPQPPAGTRHETSYEPEDGRGPAHAPGWPVGAPEPDPAPAPLGVPRTPTGDADVDAGLERLADADHLATDGHVEVYEDVHRGLRDALTALDARPGPPAPPRPSYEVRS
ncbi:hypothetical protein [Streptomyces shenzhenensis]|uniref:Uncharacterized protein n=1 Tax=Streptomyces shenzhenensis TaxID=943815 RepID=A0A3M0IEQ5_9ACTN|nr:hypothetical protein [Streptomyces shenzhenensis]RMB86540.1 hypothetical protein CTZ28_05535 [Streptomyces shenzhenensis]